MILHQSLIYSVLFGFLVYFLLGCKPKGKDEPQWKEESQRLAMSLCAHLLRCSQDSDWQTLPEKWSIFAKGKLEENSCQSEFRKSNIFELRVPDPEFAKTQFKGCLSKIFALDCVSIRQNDFSKIKECQVVEALQNGENP